MNDIMHTIELPSEKGFDLRINFLVEYSQIFDHFPDDTEKQLQEIYNKLDRYQAVWFCAQVVASRAGIDLGSAYLGGCLHDDYEDFLKDSYLADLIEESIEQAKENIEKINNV